MLLPRFGTSAFLLLGVNACEVLEIVPLFEDFMAELPFKMAVNMRIIGVLLYQASEQTKDLVTGIRQLSETGRIGVDKDFLEVRCSDASGELQFLCDDIQIDAQLKSLECTRGLLQPSYVYF